MPDESTPADSLVGLVLGGKYRIVGRLGKGGAGLVYRAVQEPLGRHVAVKVLRTDLEGLERSTFGPRFLREAAAAGSLAHPNIVRIHDFGQDGELYYVAMELLEGRTLAEAAKDGPFPPERAAKVVLGIARGLKHAHQAGLIHRDVKPTNVVLVRDDDGQERPMLLDFGLVKSVGDDTGLTLLGQAMGTPAYMAPEQAKGEAVNLRADVYALGCVMYRILAGKLPYHADTPLGMALQHTTGVLPTIAERSPDVVVPPALEAIVRRAMEKEADARYPEIGELVADLERWLAIADEVPLERIDEPPAPTWMPAPAAESSPRRVGLLVGAAAVVALVAALVAVAGVGGLVLGMLVPDPVVAAPDPPPARSPPPPAPAPVEPQPVAVEPVRPPPPPEPAPTPPPPTPQKPKAVPRPTPPEPEPEPVPAADPLVVDGVRFQDDAHTQRALQFANTADATALSKAGVFEKQVPTILEKRPFASIQAFGATYNIGPKTVQAIANATK